MTNPASQGESLKPTTDGSILSGDPKDHPATSLSWHGVLAPFVAMPFVISSFLFLVVRPGAPSSVLAPSSDARSP